MSDPVILQYLRSIESKIDNIAQSVEGHAEKISSLENTRAEQRGAAKLASVIAAFVGAGVSYLIQLIGKHS